MAFEHAISVGRRGALTSSLSLSHSQPNPAGQHERYLRDGHTPRKGNAVAISDYLDLFHDAGITSRSDQESYSRRLDAVVVQEQISAADIVGVGERGTAGRLDLYVVHREAVVLTSERGWLNKRVEAHRVCPIAAVGRLHATQEGFKGTELTITAEDAHGRMLFKIAWGLGGPDWVGPLVDRQRQHLLNVINRAMVRVP